MTDPNEEEDGGDSPETNEETNQPKTGQGGAGPTGEEDPDD